MNPVYVIIDPNFCKDPIGLVRKIADNADVIQLRWFGEERKSFLDLAGKMREIIEETPFIINSEIDIATAVNADGVHLEKSLDVKKAKKVLGEKIIGVSVSNPNNARKAEKRGASYIIAGAVYPTRTAKFPPIGIMNLIRIVHSVDIPVYAAGGINTANIKEIIPTGVDGVAVMSSIYRSSNPEKTIDELRGCFVR